MGSYVRLRAAAADAHAGAECNDLVLDVHEEAWWRCAMFNALIYSVCEIVTYCGSAREVGSDPDSR